MQKYRSILDKGPPYIVGRGSMLMNSNIPSYKIETPAGEVYETNKHSNPFYENNMKAFWNKQ
jgi:hypothetical protein